MMVDIKQTTYFVTEFNTISTHHIPVMLLFFIIIYINDYIRYAMLHGAQFLSFNRTPIFGISFIFK